MSSTGLVERVAVVFKVMDMMNGVGFCNFCVFKCRFGYFVSLTKKETNFFGVSGGIKFYVCNDVVVHDSEFDAKPEGLISLVKLTTEHVHATVPRTDRCSKNTELIFGFGNRSSE